MTLRTIAILAFTVLLHAAPLRAAFDYSQLPPLSAAPAPLAEDTGLAPAPRGQAAYAPTALEPEEAIAANQENLLRLISPIGYFDYDEEQGLVYSRERARIEYEGLILEGDRMIYDINLQEVQAEGNVVLALDEQRIEADAIRFNFENRSGAAYNASGRVGVMAFETTDREGVPAFQQINTDVTLIRDISLTTDDFPIPMYDIRAKEVMVLSNERVLLRSATLYVRGVPVFYLPYYSRSLGEAFPWYFKFGSSSQSGFYARLGYSYRHERLEPSMVEGQDPVVASKGHADIHADYFTERGPGAGVEYRYEFDDRQHRGRIELYAIPDNERNLGDEEDTMRWQALMRHRSEVGRGIYLQLNADGVSDPEVYYDLLDSFGDLDRGRIPERGARAALTVNRDNWLGRIRVEIRDRIGRDRFTSFSDPNDNNRDFDVQPGIEDKDDEGISRDRWGRVSLKAPEINFFTNYMRLAQSDFYYRVQVNLFNSLERGLNVVSDGNFTARDTNGDILYRGRDIDTFVQGIDFYNQLMHVTRINDRVTWVNSAGFGAGVAQRLDNEDAMVDGSRGFAPTGDLWNPGTDDTSGYYDGLWFTDANTYHAGWGDQLFSPDDISEGFAYADFESRLNARFSDALTGYVRYLVRGTSDNYIGDWYASQGDQAIRADLYDFPLRSHWADAGMNYALLYPAITMYTGAGRNLVGQDDLWPNELMWYYTPIGARYSSDQRVVVAGASVTLLEQQYYHPSDPRSFLSQQVHWGGDVRYNDPSEMWWVRLAAAWRSNLNDSLDDEDDTSLFEEGDSRFEIEPSFGTRVGPKWTVVGSTTYDSSLSAFEGARFSLNRDLHDALLAFRVRLREEIFSRQDREDEGQGGLLDNLDFSVTIQPKLPQQTAPLGAPQRSTLDQRFRSTRLELEG